MRLFIILSIFAVLVITILGTLGSISSNFSAVLISYQKIILTALLIIGFSIALIKKVKILYLLKFNEHDLLSKVSIFLIVLIIFFAIINSFTLSNNGGHFYYHLLAPLLWSDHGKIFALPQWPVVYQSHYWEYFFFWAFSLFKFDQGQGLIEAHYFSQWIHTCFGYGGTSVALYFLVFIWKLIRYRDEQWQFFLGLRLSFLIPV